MPSFTGLAIYEIPGFPGHSCTHVTFNWLLTFSHLQFIPSDFFDYLTGIIIGVADLKSFQN